MFAWLAQSGRKLGLAGWDSAIQKAAEHSLLLKIPFWLVRASRQRFRAAVEHSRSIPYLETLSLLLVLLLLASLPFVESRESALIVLVALFFSACRVLLLDEKYPLGALFWLVCFFIAWGAVATLISPFPKYSLYGYSKEITYFLGYLCFVINLRSLRDIRLSIWVLVLVSLLVSLKGLYQWHIKVPPLALWDDPDSRYKITRVYSYLGNPNLLGGYLLPVLSLTGFFALYQRGWRMVLLLVAFALQLVCLYFTYSRGAYIACAGSFGLAFGVCLMVYWPEFEKRPFLKYSVYAAASLAVLAVIVFVLTNPALRERVASLTSREHSSNNFRWNVWTSSWLIIKEYMWTGVGLGNKVFQRIYTYYMATGFQALSTYNVPLEIWLERGLFGLLSFVALMLAHLGRALWAFGRWELPREMHALLGAAFVGLLALMLHGMVDTVFYRPPVQFLFWYLLALIAVLTDHEFRITETTSD